MLLLHDFVSILCFLGGFRLLGPVFTEALCLSTARAWCVSILVASRREGRDIGHKP